MRRRSTRLTCNGASRNSGAPLRHASASTTSGYYVSALDQMRKADGNWVPKPEEEQIYVTLFARTMVVAAGVTALCFLLGYPLAYFIAHLDERRSRNLVLILVLLPFWTSLLVRTTAWIALLQTNGVANDAVAAVAGEGARLELIHNMTGTIIAMTHILLPFMILPTYSVMLSVPPALKRAAVSLGAAPWTAFWRVYFPMTLPRRRCGRPARVHPRPWLLHHAYPVGGRTGQLISNMIEFHMKTSLNWGLAAALGRHPAQRRACALCLLCATGRHEQTEARLAMANPKKRWDQSGFDAGLNRWFAIGVLVFSLAPLLVVIPLSFNGALFQLHRKDADTATGWLLAALVSRHHREPAVAEAMKKISIIIALVSTALATVLGYLFAAMDWREATCRSATSSWRC